MAETAPTQQPLRPDLVEGGNAETLPLAFSPPETSR